MNRVGSKINADTYIQTWSNDYMGLLNKPYENEVTLIRQNPRLFIRFNLI